MGPCESKDLTFSYAASSKSCLLSELNVMFLFRTDVLTCSSSSHRFFRYGKNTCKFSGLYPLRGNFYGRYKLGCVREKDPLPSSHTPLVFLTNPCNFVSFLTNCLKILALFGSRAQNFPLILLFYSV